MIGPGSTISHYRVLSKLGEGGMGEVWRATDTKLSRDVAIKILPASFAGDADRIARFAREAQVLAALNHPHIAAIYGIEQDALVMELIEGPTLSERMREGRVPVKEALTIACQIAAALDAAHEKGIVHRDLKPANIKFTQDGVVKVLDFGLAKVAESRQRQGEETATLGLTESGVILGTAGYMSPEQAKGKASDKRADIWAFGVVVYEMLTGERLFHGESAAEAMAAVFTVTPDLERVPAEARLLLQRCLEKDPKQRLRDIGEARFLLQQPADRAVAPRSRAARMLPWIAASLAVAAAAGIGYYRAGSRQPEMLPLHLRVDLGPEAVRGLLLESTISPDGRSLLFPGKTNDGERALAIRKMDGSGVRTLAGTEGAANPFFSPDGRQIGFSSGGKLRKVPMEGGAVITITDAVTAFGASWGDDQGIVFAPGPINNLLRISAGGDRSAPITQLSDRGDATHRWPQVLPGSDTVIFTSHKIVTGFDDALIEAVNVRTGERKVLRKGGYFGRYAETRGGKGYLLYVREGVLFGVPFHAKTLAVHGEPVPLLDDLAGDSDSGAGQFDLAASGTLVYRSGKGPARKWPLLWLDGSGKTEPLVATPDAYYTPKFSPDGRRLAVSFDHGDRGREIEAYDIERGSFSPLTATGGVNLFPVWSPDGRYVVFESSTPRGYGLGIVRADRSGSRQLLAEYNSLLIPSSFSPDGRFLFYHQLVLPGGYVSWVAPFDAADPDHPKLGTARRLLDTQSATWNAVVSPNGRWVAYASSETGKNVVYVTSFPLPGARWQVSDSGGTMPIWAPDGRRIYVKGADGRIMYTDCREEGAALITGKPQFWSNAQAGNSPFGREATLSADGKRFVVIPVREATAETGTVHVTLALNFLDELERKFR